MQIVEYNINATCCYKKASDSHYKRNLKKKRFRLRQELKKEAIPA